MYIIGIYKLYIFFVLYIYFSDLAMSRNKDYNILFYNFFFIIYYFITFFNYFNLLITTSYNMKNYDAILN